MPALKIIIQQPQNLHRNQFSQLCCGLCWQSQYCWSAARDEKNPIARIGLNNGLFIQKSEKEESISKIILMLPSRNTRNMYGIAWNHNAHLPNTLVKAPHASKAPFQNH